ncbi:MAG: pyridoxal phosphate-dependent aminotransferase [Rhodospirillales bacterium]|nr:pyridoxal phosphate-dependent aminotransferase [Rhodospirillales bacterium]MCW8862162.1 pyridoxal phosphate-dependent aminotransferase [Rhodospirillales bacterium]MCW8951852.1 pyridoxal phosphate-dependent aminotransferase [Rhodospirillales bacterium]MCW8969663.1 pyridoxal phosphate-dependent aminotransferase [Rhodospirillales bacterium]MCW9003234.1 pyridoxal phosphate-dependent aminotransferase [Rhodospirillales bacterium]
MNNPASLVLASGMSRLGTESAFEVLARAKALEEQGRSIINLGIGQPDFQTPQNIVEAAVKALRDGHHGYTPANGIRPLREAVAADIAARRGVTVDPDNILVVPGGKPTMFFAVLMFGEPGAEIIYPNPGFPIYESVINYSGATAVPMPLHEKNGFSFSAEEVLSLITPKTRLIIVNTPANPTGGVVPKAEMDKLAAGLEKHPHVAILSDEIYSRMLYDGREHATMLAYPALRDRLILLDGWSKTYAMTGWRIGYSVWPANLIGAATRLAINDHSCVNAPTQLAAIEALTGPQDEVDKMMAAFAERRKVIVDELNDIPGFNCTEPGGAFYAFPNIAGTGIGSKALQDRLLNEAGIATVSGTSFGRFGEGYIRFSYANSVENIREAMARIRKIL